MSPSPAGTAVARRPTIARDPRRASPILSPDYRRGQKPPNNGMMLPAEVLSHEEIDRLFGALILKRKVEIRLDAKLGVMYRCGLRLAESLNLEPKDIDFARGTVAVLAGKGSRPGSTRNRTLGLDDGAIEKLLRWVETREELGIGARSKLFCNTFAPNRGGDLWHSQVRGAMKLLAERAGIERRVHPHGLRHTHAFELRMEGWDMEEIRQQLGHSRLDTTARYIGHLAPVRRIARARTRAWGPPPEHAELSPEQIAMVVEFIRRQMASDELLAA